MILNIEYKQKEVPSGITLSQHAEDYSVTGLILEGHLQGIFEALLEGKNTYKKSQRYDMW